MRVASKSSKPTFFWQGVLILLPVIIMTGIALAAIAQDRASVERESRRRAQEIADQFKSTLEQRWAAELIRFDTLFGAWSTASSARQSWPGDQPAADAAQTNYATMLTALSADYPDLTPADFLPYHYLDFSDDGTIRHPSGADFPPQPAPF